MPEPSPQLLRSLAVAREIEATLRRIETKIERATFPRGVGELRAEVRAEVAAYKRVVWIGYGCHIAVAAVVLALVWAR